MVGYDPICVALQGSRDRNLRNTPRSRDDYMGWLNSIRRFCTMAGRPASLPSLPRSPPARRARPSPTPRSSQPASASSTAPATRRTESSSSVTRRSRRSPRRPRFPRPRPAGPRPRRHHRGRRAEGGARDPQHRDAPQRQQQRGPHRLDRGPHRRDRCPRYRGRHRAGAAARTEDREGEPRHGERSGERSGVRADRRARSRAVGGMSRDVWARRRRGQWRDKPRLGRLTLLYRVWAGALSVIEVVEEVTPAASFHATVRLHHVVGFSHEA